MDFGDGTRVNLGAVSGPAIPVQHVYTTGGSYTVSVTATDSGGGTSTAASVVVVGFQAPATVRITADPAAPARPAVLVTLTATLAPPSLIGAQYLVDVRRDHATRRRRPRSTRRSSPTPLRGTYKVEVEVTLVGNGQKVTGDTMIIVVAPK